MASRTGLGYMVTATATFFIMSPDEIGAKTRVLDGLDRIDDRPWAERAEIESVQLVSFDSESGSNIQAIKPISFNDLKE